MTQGEVHTWRRDASNLYTAANSVTEGLVSESVQQIFVEGGRVLHCAVDAERVVVGPDGEETRKFSALLQRGVAEEVVGEFRQSGDLKKMREPKTKLRTKREQVEETLDLLVEMETGIKVGQKSESAEEEEERDPDVEEVLRAGYHKDLEYTRRPKIECKPSWY